MRALLLAVMTVTLGVQPAASQTPKGAADAVCWTADEQRSLAKEITPRAGASGARIAPPRRDLAPFSETPSRLRGAVRRVTLPDGVKMVALTFDLCEAGHEIAGYDGRIIDYLREHDLKATFFAGGKWLLTHGERAQQLIADSRYEIANHGWRHANFRNLSGQSLHDEIDFAQSAYEEIRGRLEARQCLGGNALTMPDPPERMALLRFPYGTCNAQALDAVATAGLLAIQWDVATGDPDPRQSAKAIAARVLRLTRPGSIILGHANGRGYNTSAALPLFIPALREQGYQFVTVSELLAAGTPEISQKCYDLVAGDTERWVASARLKRSNRGDAKKGGGREWNPFQH